MSSARGDRVSTVDVNSDLGESFGNWRFGSDAELMPQISSANVACGFHASDPLTMVRTVRLAKEHGVAVGAHPGLPDLLGFGRRMINVSAEDLYAYVVYQVGALQGVLSANDMGLHHVKPHGVLPEMLRNRPELGASAAEALADLGVKLAYLPAPVETSSFAREAEARGIRVIGEIYPDLSYAPDGTLVIQREKRATDLEDAARQVRRFLDDGCVLAEDGTPIPLRAESICVHSDGPNAPDVARAVRQAIEDAGYRVTAASQSAVAS